MLSLLSFHFSKFAVERLEAKIERQNTGLVVRSLEDVFASIHSGSEGPDK